jgi:hypothetical protein
VLGVKECDAYLPSSEEVIAMIKQSQETMKNAEPSPDDKKKLASADLDTARAKQIDADMQGASPAGNLNKVRADQIQAEVAGNTASSQLEGYALIKEHKAKAYGT